METLRPIITEHAFFKGFKPEHIDLIVGCASNVRFNAGEFLYRAGEEATQFFVIRQGKVALEQFAAERGSIIIQTVGEGDIFGWSWLIAPYQWFFDARAMELTRAIAFDGKCLRTKCDEDHDLGYELLKRFTPIIAKRLEALRIQLSDIYGKYSEKKNGRHG
jgi:CRP-like cAMP-binding protein